MAAPRPLVSATGDAVAAIGPTAVVVAEKCCGPEKKLPPGASD